MLTFLMELCRVRIFSKFHVRSVPGTVRFRVYCAAESVNLRIRLVGSGNYESPSVGEPPLQESGLFQKFKNSRSDFDKTVIGFWIEIVSSVISVRTHTPECKSLKQKVVNVDLLAITK